MAAPKPSRPVPRLYLVTAPVSDTTALVETLASAIAGADVAALLVRLIPADERTQINRIKALATPVQKLGVAVLVDGDPALAARSGADGAHLTGIEALR